MSYSFSKGDRELLVFNTNTDDVCMLCNKQSILTINITNRVVRLGNAVLFLCGEHANDMIVDSIYVYDTSTGDRG